MSSDSEDDVLITADDAKDILPPISEATLPSVATRATGLYSDRDGAKLSGASIDAILQACTVKQGDDGAFYLSRDGHTVNVGVVVTSRATWAMTNGPDGSLVLASWKPGSADQTALPDGVTIEPHQGPSYTSYTLTVEDTESTSSWVTQLFDSHFVQYGTRGEWTFSGAPIDNTLARDIHDGVHKKFKASAVQMGVKGEADVSIPSNGPGRPMWLLAERSVLIKKSLKCDEGRGSEYIDFHGTLASMGPTADLKYNRVPNVEVRDHLGQYSPMSWHQLHKLGGNAIYKLLVTPRAFVTRNKQVKWTYRLTEISVLGTVCTPPVFNIVGLTPSP
ncbi:hypothetical protein GGG16DRAFT_120036 [Schizophyllum commune]